MPDPEGNVLKYAVLILKLLVSAGLLAFLAWRAAREDQFQGIFAGREYGWCDFLPLVPVGPRLRLGDAVR